MRATRGSAAEAAAFNLQSGENERPEANMYRVWIALRCQSRRGVPKLEVCMLTFLRLRDLLVCLMFGIERVRVAERVRT